LHCSTTIAKACISVQMFIVQLVSEYLC